MKLLRIITIALVVAGGVSGQTIKSHVTPAANVAFPVDPTDPLSTLRPGHPRLFATAEDFDRIARATDDPLRVEVRRRVLATANHFLPAPLVEYKLTGRNNKVLHDLLLKQSRLALQRISLFAMAYRLTHEVRYANRVKAELINVAGFKDWTPEEFLATAEMSLAVAIGYDWCYDALTPAQRATVRNGLIANALHFVPELFGTIVHAQSDLADPRLWWVISPNNWNQVCLSGLLAGALAIADDEPEIARLAIRGTRTYLPLSMHTYAPDGTWPEGPGYWSYGTTYNVVALAALQSALGTDFGLSNTEPDFAKTALYRLDMQGAKNTVFNYADSATSWDACVTPAFGWLATRYSIEVAAAAARKDLSDFFAESSVSGATDRFFALHALWLPPEPKTITPSPLDAHFRGDADLAVFHSAWNDPDAIYVGFKNGRNGVAHSHKDLGSFVLDADGVRWAASLGPEDYELPGFFGDKRFTYFRMNNLSQNVVTPNAELQFGGASAPIIAFRSEANEGSAIADLSAVYPKAMKKMFRGIFLLDRARVLVQDEIIGLAPNRSLYWRMITPAKINVASDGRSATLTQRGKTLRAELLAPDSARFSARPAKPPTAIENQNEGFSILEATIPAVANESYSRLGVVLTPVGVKWPDRLPMPTLRDHLAP